MLIKINKLMFGSACASLFIKFVQRMFFLSFN